MNSDFQYLYGLTRFGIKPGLGIIERMMDGLGHPEKEFKSIHVTGTNGKGSTCAMMESILREAGYTTALYTSPHLYTFNERIQINRVPISDENLTMLVKEIREICGKQRIQPTFFEFTTALAFLYFARASVDIALIEVGMGGRYDATNVISPLVSVITNVGLDHMEYFGPTKAHVAREKAGIIKDGIPVVTSEKDPVILKIFNDEALRQHTTVIRVWDVVSANLASGDLDGQDVEVRLLTPTPAQSGDSPLYKGEKYAISSPRMRGGNLPAGQAGVGSFVVHLPLLGSHQIENMKTAIAALTVLGERGTLNSSVIAAGIAKTKWEGRLQVISKEPLIIVDGAHNGDGACAIAQFLQHIPRRDVLVFAAKRGKDISDMLTYVVPLFSHVIVTEGSFVPESAELLAKKIREGGKGVVVEKNPGKAFDLGRSLLSRDGMLLVTGSLYMVADVLAYLSKIEV